MLSHKRGSKKRNFDWVTQFSVHIHGSEIGNSDINVLTIALRYTAASVFRTGDSLTPFRDSVSVFSVSLSSTYSVQIIRLFKLMRPC